MHKDTRKLICLHLPTDCFIEISLQSTLTLLLIEHSTTCDSRIHMNCITDVCVFAREIGVSAVNLCLTFCIISSQTCNNSEGLASLFKLIQKIVHAFNIGKLRAANSTLETKRCRKTNRNTWFPPEKEHQ